MVAAAKCERSSRARGKLDCVRRCNFIMNLKVIEWFPHPKHFSLHFFILDFAFHSFASAAAATAASLCCHDKICATYYTAIMLESDVWSIRRAIEIQSEKKKKLSYGNFTLFASIDMLFHSPTDGISFSPRQTCLYSALVPLFYARRAYYTVRALNSPRLGVV